jgi:hypothetical protein
MNHDTTTVNVMMQYYGGVVAMYLVRGLRIHVCIDIVQLLHKLIQHAPGTLDI